MKNLVPLGADAKYSLVGLPIRPYSVPNPVFDLAKRKLYSSDLKNEIVWIVI
jgi:hypothetical protein